MAKTGLLGRMALGAAAGAAKGYGEASVAVAERKAKKEDIMGLASMQSMFRRIEAGERFAFEAGQGELTREARLKEAEEQRTFKAGESKLGREAAARRPSGSPFAGESGILYGRAGSGETTAISVDGKPILAPKKGGFTEKDEFNMLLREAGRIRKTNADSFGDLTEDEIMSQASANVESAKRFGRGPKAGPEIMEVGGALPMPKSKSELVNGKTYQTPKGPLVYKDGKWWKSGQNRLKSASDAETSAKQAEQPEVAARGKQPVKASLPKEYQNTEVEDLVSRIRKADAEALNLLWDRAELGDDEAGRVLQFLSVQGVISPGGREVAPGENPFVISRR